MLWQIRSTQLQPFFVFFLSLFDLRWVFTLTYISKKRCPYFYLFNKREFFFKKKLVFFFFWARWGLLLYEFWWMNVLEYLMNSFYFLSLNFFCSIQLNWKIYFFCRAHLKLNFKIGNVVKFNYIFYEKQEGTLLLLFYYLFTKGNEYHLNLFWVFFFYNCLKIFIYLFNLNSFSYLL